MPKLFLSPALVAPCLALSVVGAGMVTPASAQIDRSWIASTGDNANNCSRATPCATIEGAFGKTNAGGEIMCADSGNFFPSLILINKSITINCEGHVASSAGGAIGVAQFNILVGAQDRVLLRGFDIDLVSSNVTNGINFTGAGVLVLERVKITSARAPGFALSGISFLPNGPAKLVVTESIIAFNGTSTGGAGILVKPAAGGSAQVHIQRTTVASNNFGIAFDGSSSTAGINATIAASVMTANALDGVLATTGAAGAPIGVLVSNSWSTNNGFGIRSIGPNVTVRVDGSKITGNGTGLAFGGGGALLTAANNIVEANGSNGGFSGAIGLK